MENLDKTTEAILNRKLLRDQEIQQLFNATNNEKTNDENSLIKNIRKTPQKEVEKVPTPASVKSLRSRWEISSATGTPLHPDSNTDDLSTAVMNLSQQRPPIKRNIRQLSSVSSHTSSPKKPVLAPEPPPKPLASIVSETVTLLSNRTPVKTVRAPEPPPKPHVSIFRGTTEFPTRTSEPQPKPVTSTFHESTEVSTWGQDIPPKHFVSIFRQTTEISSRSPDPLQKPHATTFCETAEISTPLDETDSIGSRSSDSQLQNFNNQGQQSGSDVNVNLEIPATPLGSGFYRPITPNNEIIGSLMDDINNELEKYNASKTSSSNTALGGSDHNTPKNHGDDDTTHTISHYRRQGARLTESKPFGLSLDSSTPGILQRQSATPLTSISVSQTTEMENAVSSPSSPNDEATLKRLHETIIVQQDQICQASRALAFCRQNENFRGSREEVDAQRALLIATERRRALMVERERVMNGKSSTGTTGPDPTGTLTFSHIAIKLARDFINTYVQQNNITSHYYFIILIKCGETVLHTTLANSDEGLKSGFVEFSHYIQLSGLSPDFLCELEVYSLRAAHEGFSMDKSKSKKGTWRRIVSNTPLGSGSNTISGYSASRPIGVMDPGFQKVGHLSLNRSLLSRQKFLLADSVYPLDGSVVLNMKCFAETGKEAKDYRSFLSLYQVVSGLGAWTRFWCVLDNAQMRFWRYPEDEDKKQPTVSLPLNKCLSYVSSVSSTVASFPHSMQVDVMIADEGKREDIHMLFAADTHESKEIWLAAINQAIRNANVWNCSKK